MLHRVASFEERAEARCGRDADISSLIGPTVLRVLVAYAIPNLLNDPLFWSWRYYISVCHRAKSSRLSFFTLRISILDVISVQLSRTRGGWP